MADRLFLEQETFRVRGAIFEVHSRLGCGFLEAVYQECLAIEFERLGVPFQAHAPLRLTYRERTLQQTYVADFVCYGGDNR